MTMPRSWARRAPTAAETLEWVDRSPFSSFGKFVSCQSEEPVLRDEGRMGIRPGDAEREAARMDPAICRGGRRRGSCTGADLSRLTFGWLINHAVYCVDPTIPP